MKANKIIDTEGLNEDFYALDFDKNGNIIKVSHGEIPSDIYKAGYYFEEFIGMRLKSWKYKAFEGYLIFTMLILLPVMFVCVRKKLNLIMSIMVLVFFISNYLMYQGKKIMLKGLFVEVKNLVKSKKNSLRKLGFDIEFFSFYGSICDIEENVKIEMIIKIEFSRIEKEADNSKSNSTPGLDKANIKKFTQKLAVGMQQIIWDKDYYIMGMAKNDREKSICFYPKNYKFKSTNQGIELVVNECLIVFT